MVDSPAFSSSDVSAPSDATSSLLSGQDSAASLVKGDEAEESAASSISNLPSAKSREKFSEIDEMRETFARLLLGEDMSGGGNGVTTALAISNAITNLSASIFGNLWKLEPLAPNKRKMWKREMDWLLAVADHIVELVPTWQAYPDGGSVEVMVANARPDIQMNLPALRKLDMMLLECLDNFRATEFLYVEQEHMVCCKETSRNHSVTRDERKWWLPVPKVPDGGLSEDSRKSLLQHKESTNQIFKAATAINAQVLSEMEVPDAYLEGLPKNGKIILGDLYRSLAVEDFSPETLLSAIDISSEYDIVQLANRLEASVHIWHHKLHNKQLQQEAKLNRRASWVMVKELVADPEKREVLVERAERLLGCLRQKFPGMPQSLLDMQKIQYNKDVGQAILESYSRVLESVAFNIVARIDDVLTVDAAARVCSSETNHTVLLSSGTGHCCTSSCLATGGISSPSLVKDVSRRQKGVPLFSTGKTLADYMKLDPFSKRVYATVPSF